MFNKKITQYQREAKDQAKKLAEQAVRLKSTDEYKAYESRYRQFRAALIDEMLNCSEDDPIRYAFQMNSYVERIKALGILTNEIDNDINRGMDDEAK